MARALDTWLQAQGAQALHPRIEVNQLESAAIRRWQHLLSHIAGTDDAPDWRAPPFSAWRLHHRQQLNLGSDSAPIYHLELRPADGTLPSWQAGDLAQIKLSPHEMNQANQISETIERDYSIASIPENGSVQLLVRLQTRENGEFGLVSGHLTQRLAIGDTIQLRLRAHPRFQIGANHQRPLILIGNGSGMAGLRSHLLARAQAGAGPNWLIFGERHAATDFYYRTEIEAWQASGVLQQLDMVFSRDQPEKRYVQDRLHEVADLLRVWIERDAAIYVCGSLQTMAGGVHQALLDMLGESGLSMLADSGRYQRDVY